MAAVQARAAAPSWSACCCCSASSARSSSVGAAAAVAAGPPCHAPHVEAGAAAARLPPRAAARAPAADVWLPACVPAKEADAAAARPAPCCAPAGVDAAARLDPCCAPAGAAATASPLPCCATAGSAAATARPARCAIAMAADASEVMSPPPAGRLRPSCEGMTVVHDTLQPLHQPARTLPTVLEGQKLYFASPCPFRLGGINRTRRVHDLYLQGGPCSSKVLAQLADDTAAIGSDVK